MNKRLLASNLNLAVMMKKALYGTHQGHDVKSKFSPVRELFSRWAKCGRVRSLCTYEFLARPFLHPPPSSPDLSLVIRSCPTGKQDKRKKTRVMARTQRRSSCSVAFGDECTKRLLPILAPGDARCALPASRLHCKLLLDLLLSVSAVQAQDPSFPRLI